MSCPPIAQLEPSFRVLTKEEKASASKTVVVFGRIGGEAVALKVFSQRGARRAGLLQEVRLYQEVTELLRLHVTPNVARYVGYWVCSAAALRRLGALPRALPSPVGVLATERIQGPSVQQALHAQELSLEELYSVVFQVIHAVANLSTAGIRHADLHTANVLLEPHGAAHRTDYRARLGQLAHWRVPTPWLVKLFDWDMGELEAGPPNPHAAAHCERFDVCGHNDKADLYTFLDSVWLKAKRKPRYTEAARTIEGWIARPLLEAGAPDGLFERRGGMAKRLCRGPISDDCDAEATWELCSGAWRPPNCQMATPETMLADRAFARWRRPRLTGAWGTDERLV